MQMHKKILLDANVLVRLFEGESAAHFDEAVAIMASIESGEVDAMLLDLIAAEVVYVSRRIYRRDPSEIAQVLRSIVQLPHVHVENPPVMLRALDLYATDNIDFADAILCAKKEIEGYEIASFDKRVAGC
jgi:predicted nucleic acid-binding protein